MKTTSCFTAVTLLLALAVAPAAAANLGQIERRIAVEPDDLKTPTYCLMVFGPEARMHRWLILDGNNLYVDLNGNGDLTDPGEKVALASVDLGLVTDADGTERNARLKVERMTFGMRLQINVGGRCTQFVGFDYTDRLAFADRAEDAPIVHIGGPLTFRWFGNPPELKAGQRCKLFTALGTPGLGKGTFAAVQCCHVPKEIGKTALLDFPHRDLGQPPIQHIVSLAAD